MVNKRALVTSSAPLDVIAVIRGNTIGSIVEFGEWDLTENFPTTRRVSGAQAGQYYGKFDCAVANTIDEQTIQTMELMSARQIVFRSGAHVSDSPVGEWIEIDCSDFVFYYKCEDLDRELSRISKELEPLTALMAS